VEPRPAVHSQLAEVLVDSGAECGVAILGRPEDDLVDQREATDVGGTAGLPPVPLRSPRPATSASVTTTMPTTMPASTTPAVLRDLAIFSSDPRPKLLRGIYE